MELIGKIVARVLSFAETFRGGAALSTRRRRTLLVRRSVKVIVKLSHARFMRGEVREDIQRNG